MAVPLKAIFFSAASLTYLKSKTLKLFIENNRANLTLLRIYIRIIKKFHIDRNVRKKEETKVKEDIEEERNDYPGRRYVA